MCCALKTFVSGVNFIQRHVLNHKQILALAEETDSDLNGLSYDTDGN